MSYVIGGRPRSELFAPAVSNEEGNARSNAAISLQNVTVKFTNRGRESEPVLDRLNLEIRRQQFVSLVGASGCGKTTILNLVAGLLKPTSGNLDILGGTPASSRIKTGYMFANDALLPWRSVQSNVEYGMELRGTDKATRRKTARQYLRMVGLEHAVDYWPWQLSQGMRQRVALARTWALHPELMLMDEPFSALDAQTRHGLQAELLRLWEQQRTTVLFVTHDINEALCLSDRVILLGKGRILIDTAIEFERPRDLNELQSDVDFQRLRRELQSQLV